MSTAAPTRALSAPISLSLENLKLLNSFRYPSTLTSRKLGWLWAEEEEKNHKPPNFQISFLALLL